MARYRDKVLDEAAERIAQAERDFLDRARELYPVGKLVGFRKGKGHVDAEIIMGVGFHPRVKVRSLKSGKEYWVTVYDLARAE